MPNTYCTIADHLGASLLSYATGTYARNLKLGESTGLCRSSAASLGKHLVWCVGALLCASQDAPKAVLAKTSAALAVHLNGLRPLQRQAVKPRSPRRCSECPWRPTGRYGCYRRTSMRLPCDATRPPAATATLNAGSPARCDRISSCCTTWRSHPSLRGAPAAALNCSRTLALQCKSLYRHEPHA